MLRDVGEAVKWVQLAAEQGYASAQRALGDLYRTGKGVPDGMPQDYAEAVKWYRLAAEQGNTSAQYDLGRMYYNGEGVPQDYAEAVKWYRLAAEQGNTSAQYDLGSMYRNDKGVPRDNGEAFKWYRLAVEQGDEIAQMSLGLMCLITKGEPVVRVEACRLGAEQEYAASQYSLGVMYYNGEGVPQDYAEAFKWCRLAAEQGYASAQRALGVMYDTGKGVPQNDIQAHMWFNLAGARGNENDVRKARKARDIVKDRMTPEQIAEAQHLASEWKPRTEKDRELYGDTSTAIGAVPMTDAPAQISGSPPDSDALQQWDDDDNRRITCAEARRHGLAPVHRGHPAYSYMRDPDNDGIVCK